MNNNEYHRKIEEYIHFAEKSMYIFQILYTDRRSSFIFMYKQETIFDLYNKISFHFGCNDIKNIFYYTQSGQRMRLNYRPTLQLVDLINRVAPENDATLEVVSAPPNPSVYRLFLEE